MLIYMVTVGVMQMSVMKIVDVVTMLDGCVAAIWAVNVVVIRVFVAILAHRSLLIYYLWGARMIETRPHNSTINTFHELFKCLTVRKGCAKL